MVKILDIGNGRSITAQDTVPFALWYAAQHIDNYEEALWLTAIGKGDIDTNWAMVGGIVAAHTETKGISAEWLHRRENFARVAIPSKYK